MQLVLTTWHCIVHDSTVEAKGSDTVKILLILIMFRKYYIILPICLYKDTYSVNKNKLLELPCTYANKTAWTFLKFQTNLDIN